jgi:hypothetical protein
MRRRHLLRASVNGTFLSLRSRARKCAVEELSLNLSEGNDRIKEWECSSGVSLDEFGGKIGAKMSEIFEGRSS